MLPVDTHLGELTINYVLVEYDGPQLFVCTNRENVSFLVMHAPETKEGDNWIYRRITAEEKQTIPLLRIKLRQFFESEPENVLTLVTFSSEENVLTRSIAPSSLPEGFLPDYGTELEPTEFISLPTIVGSTDILPGEHYNYDIAKQTILGSSPLIEAQQSGRVVLDLTLNVGGEHHRRDLPAGALGKLLTCLQSLTDSLGGSPQSRGPVKLDVREWTRLDAVAVFPSSFGLRLETHIGGLSENPGQTSLQALFDILAAKDDEAAIRLTLQSAGKRAASRYKLFIRALVSSEADLEIWAGFPRATAVQTVSVPLRQTKKIQSILDSDQNLTSAEFEIEGVLQAASLRTKFFMITTVDQDISGRIADEALPQMTGKELGGIHRAKGLVHFAIDEFTGEEKSRYTLTDISSVT